MKNEEELSILSEKLRNLGVMVTEFREPDLDNQLTAIAFLSDDKTKKLTSGLPLAFKTENKQYENERLYQDAARS